MERRIHKRVYLHLKARMIIDEDVYEGFIENASTSGVGSFIASSIKVKEEFLINAMIELQLTLPTGDAVSLNGKVKWTKKGLYSGNTIGLGLEIISPPDEYASWISTAC